MWSYKKEEKGYRLYANTEPINFTILIPFKSYLDINNKIIIYWTEYKIKKLVNDLNNGEIPILFKKTSQKGIVFTTKLPKEYY